ncbi:hypothetical protein CEP52_005233 [Fusarium oligoseptatum]|uniref:Uncharacterized protein n=1 Tax=Fusarium oligoseptatum TaxID=2604345 RepID=A0A428TZK2_9HYPO|nr:hypothetical protein CEP52_005233 [Fusarium oligoseptatum]
MSDRQVPVGVMNAYFMYRISRCQDYLGPLQFSFCELLTLTRQFGCQEKRDKIYGLLGLATTDEVNTLITPDYTSPLGEPVCLSQLESEMASKVTDLQSKGSLSTKSNKKVWMDPQCFKQQQSFPWEQTPGLEEILVRTGHTRRSLEKLALTLTAGKSWYGTPIANRAGMLADFAACLVTKWLWWALEPDAFGSNDEKSRNNSGDQGNSANLMDGQVVGDEKYKETWIELV